MAEKTWHKYDDERLSLKYVLKLFDFFSYIPCCKPKSIFPPIFTV